jgi:hypothetical protein
MIHFSDQVIKNRNSLIIFKYTLLLIARISSLYHFDFSNSFRDINFMKMNEWSLSNEKNLLSDLNICFKNCEFFIIIVIFFAWMTIRLSIKNLKFES